MNERSRGSRRAVETFAGYPNWGRFESRSAWRWSRPEGAQVALFIDDVQRPLCPGGLCEEAPRHGRGEDDRAGPLIEDVELARRVRVVGDASQQHLADRGEGRQH